MQDSHSASVIALLLRRQPHPQQHLRLVPVAILQKPDIREKLVKAGFNVLARGPDGLKARIDKEVPMWREVVAQTGVKIK